MISLRRLLFVAAAVFALGAVVATGAFTGGDQAVRGVYLTPADTDNGQQYTSIDDAGEIELSMTNLNPSATTVAEDVFVLGTDLDRAKVWIEDDQPAVDFYRMDTGRSVENANDPVTLTGGESVLVGVEIESGTDEMVLETISIRAQIPDQSESTPTDRPDTPTDRPDTATDRPATSTGDDTLTEQSATPTGDETPTEQSGTPTGDDTPTEQPGTPTEQPNTPTGDDTPTEQPNTPSDSTDTPTEQSDTPTDDTVSVTQTAVTGGGGAPTETTEANIRVVELTTDPTQPTVGETITVSGTFENAGATARNATLELRAGGEVIASERVRLTPGERRTLSGTVAFDQPGAYEIALADSSVTVTVTEDDQSPLEIGSFAPVILAVLALLAGGLGLFAYWRAGDSTLVVRADDASWSRVELVAEDADAATATDEDGRTTLRFDLSGRGVATFDPAFSIRNTVSETVGVRIVAVDADGEPITRGVTIQSEDGTDLAGFPADGTAVNVLDAGEALSVRVTVDRDDETAARIASLRVETTTDDV